MQITHEGIDKAVVIMVLLEIVLLCICKIMTDSHPIFTSYSLSVLIVFGIVNLCGFLMGLLFYFFVFYVGED